MEKTFVMIKPDGVKRRLVGELISKLERKGLYLVQLKVEKASKEKLEEHYKELSSKPFYKGLVEYMSSSEVVPMVWEGVNAVEVARKLMGATDPNKADLGTIRGDYGIGVGRNLIHGADSKSSAEREIKLWFGTVSEVTHFDSAIIYE